MPFKREGDRWVPITPETPFQRRSAGLWNVGPGGGRFTPAMRPELTLVQVCRLYRAAGITDLEFHDTEAPIDQAKAMMEVLRGEGLGVAMCTANLFKRPEFVNGNFGNPNPHSREAAINYTKAYIRAGVETFGCPVYVYWSGSNGIVLPLGVNYLDVYKHTAECIDTIIAWMLREFGPENALAFAIEPKTNEPPQQSVPANIGEALSLRAMLDPAHRDFVGVNPEVCHSMLSGQRYAMELGISAAAQALFHIHLNGGSGLKFDEDRAFGDCDFTVAVETLITLLEIDYRGIVGFDVQPLPTDLEYQQATSVERSVRNFRRALIAARRIDLSDLTSLRQDGNNAAVAELLAGAVSGVSREEADALEI